MLVEDINSPSAGHKQYWDSKANTMILQILPGEYFVTDKDVSITTVLGSCISVCMTESVIGAGGMNHFMLPGGGSGSGYSEVARFGTHAMELLINDLFKLGASKSAMTAKIFGGASMFESEQRVGKKNTDFAREFLRLEGIELVGEDVGLAFSRKIRFNPKTGKVMVKRLRSLHNKHIQESESQYANEIIAPPVAGDDELF